ncbi:unnamed protein product [Camellia sinensis]
MVCIVEKQHPLKILIQNTQRLQDRMNSEIADSSSLHPGKASGDKASAPAVSGQDSSADGQEDSQTGNAAKSTFARLASSMGLHLPAKASGKSEGAEGTSTTAQSSVLESLTKGFVDSFLSAVKAVQVNARHIVSQNKRRYQEGGFDLDMTYITENIIAMGFPAGDMIWIFWICFYRNHMEEVIKFFETHHKILVTIIEGLFVTKGVPQVHNIVMDMVLNFLDGSVVLLHLRLLHLSHLMTIIAPPIELITLFCQSAYTWLMEDILNVVVVHCKAGMARTGLMISSLLLFLKFFPTAEECIEYYNQKRCLDGKRYVKYFERLLTYVNGVNQPGRRCVLRGFRLVNCTYWIRPSITITDHNWGILFSTKKHPKTKDLIRKIFGSVHQKKGIVVFALPGEPSLTELSGDFKLHFHDRQRDFYCWLNTTTMENRIVIYDLDLDGFDKRNPRFTDCVLLFSNVSENQDNDDDVFSDSDGEETVSSKSSQARADSGAGPPAHLESGPRVDHQMTAVTRQGVQAE